MMYIISAITFSYLLGSLSSAVIVSKSLYGKDIRKYGSGNAGATNALRILGKKAGALVFICDFSKGLLAVTAARCLVFFLNAPYECILFAGFFAQLGHVIPLFFKFRGGKGVATSLGVILLLNWQIGVTVLIIALIIMAVSRYVSLGSVIAAIIYPILLTGYIMGAKGFENAKTESQYAIVTGIIMALLLIIKHRSNLKRLSKGTENKLFSKKKGSANK